MGYQSQRMQIKRNGEQLNSSRRDLYSRVKPKKILQEKGMISLELNGADCQENATVHCQPFRFEARYFKGNQ